MQNDKLTLAVIGVGYWGKNLVRNFALAKRCNLKYVCDLDEDAAIPPEETVGRALYHNLKRK